MNPPRSLRDPRATKAAGTTGERPERIPSIPVLHEVPAHHFTFEVEDDSFSPLIFTGDTAVIDPAFTMSDDGNLCAVRYEDAVRLWLPSPAGPWLKGETMKESWLLTVSEPYRWAGPIKNEAFEVMGVVAGLLDLDRSTEPEGELIAIYEAEWRWFEIRSVALRLKHWRLEALMPEDERPERIREMTGDQREEYRSKRHALAEMVGAADTNQRWAAVAIRSSHAEDQISATPTTTTAGALVKLLVCWDQDSDNSLIGQAIKALGGEPGPTEYTEEGLRAHYGNLDETVADPFVRNAGQGADLEAIERLRQSPVGDDRFPVWLAEWEGALAISTVNNDDDIDEELWDAVEAIQGKIIETPSQTMAGLFAKLRVMTDCIVKGAAPSEEWAADTLRAAEAVMRGPGVVVDSGGAGPDPLVALWVEWDGVRKTRFSDHVPHGDVVDPEAEEAFYEGKGDQMTVIEERIMAAVPSTLAGALVQMSVMIELHSTSAAPPQKDIDAALAGIVAGEGRTPPAADPLVALWVKWCALEWGSVPKGLTVEDSDRLVDRMISQADDVAMEIVSASPDTLIGAFAQLAVLKNWAENCAPTRAKPALGRFHDRIEAALQNAAGQAATS